MNGFAVKPVELSRLLAEIARVTGVTHLGRDSHVALHDHIAVGSTEGVDWERGTELWGDVQTLQTRIRQFLSETLQSLYRDGPLGDESVQQAAAHRLHGAAANLALTGVQAMAADLERSYASDAPPRQDVQVRWAALYAEMKALLDRLPSPTTAEALPHQSASALKHADLLTLQRYLQRGELAEEALQRVCGALSVDAREGLQAAVDNFDFDRALGIVDTLMQQLPRSDDGYQP